MKFQLKLNLISAFIIMLLFVSCSSKDNNSPITPSSGLAPSNVSGMFFEWFDPYYEGGNDAVYKITLISNDSGKMTKHFDATEESITTKSCVYKRLNSNTASIDLAVDLMATGITFSETVKFDLNFTNKNGGNSTWIKYQDNDTLRIEGTFTLKK